MSGQFKTKEQLAESQKKIDSAMGKNDAGKGLREAFNNIKSAFSSEPKEDYMQRALRERQKRVEASGN
jgi:hypothetical protein